VTDKEEQLKEAGNILLVGVVLLCAAVGLAFGLLWALVILGLFFILVAIVKAGK
jgi:hypothetical protein